MRSKALAGTVATGAFVLSACGGGGDEGGASSEESGSAGPTFGTNPSGALAAWGFENESSGCRTPGPAA